MWEDVKPGDPIPNLASFWTGLRDAARRRRLLPGVGVRLRETPTGTIINFDATAALWNHPWAPALASGELTLSPGLVDGLEPTIGGIPMSGDANNKVPTVTIDLQKFTAKGRSVVAVEIECDEQWLIKSAIIVQVAQLDDVEGASPGVERPLLPPTLPKRKTRCALVQLRKSASGAVTAVPIEMFNLKHLVLFPAGTTDETKARHWFDPA